MKGREVKKGKANIISQKMASLDYRWGKIHMKQMKSHFVLIKASLYDDISELALDMEMSLSLSCSL